MPSSPPRIGVFGGTFDPVHIGHLIVASEMRHALELDRVLFVPAGQPPHKPDRAISPNADRVAMLRLALADAPNFEICTVDLDRDGPSFTSETLAILRNQLHPATLVFLMGADSLRDLPSWHEPRRIAALAELGVAARPGVEVTMEAIEKAVPETRGRIHLVRVPLVGISSEDIRGRIAQAQPVTYHLPAAVEAYIRESGLYRTRAGDRDVPV